MPSQHLHLSLCQPCSSSVLRSHLPTRQRNCLEPGCQPRHVPAAGAVSQGLGTAPAAAQGSAQLGQAQHCPSQARVPGQRWAQLLPQGNPRCHRSLCSCSWPVCQSVTQKLDRVPGHRNVTFCPMRFSKLPVIWTGCVQARVRSLARAAPAAWQGNKLPCNRGRY